MSSPNESNRFKNIVIDIAVDHSRFLTEIKSAVLPTKQYVILFTPRSGSTWVTDTCAATNKLGIPGEYLNPSFIPSEVQSLNTKSTDDFLKILRHRKKSSNGVFGIQIRAFEIELFDHAAYHDAFGPETTYFFLWRRNLVAQAISLYKAVKSGYYHSTSSKKDTVPTIPYNRDEIMHWIRHILNIENNNYDFCKANGYKPYELIYEDIAGQSKKLVSTLSHILGVDDVELPENSVAPKKIGDSWNLSTEEQFRAENPDFIIQIESQRQIRNKAVIQITNFL